MERLSMCRRGKWGVKFWEIWDLGKYEVGFLGWRFRDLFSGYNVGNMVLCA